VASVKGCLSSTSLLSLNLVSFFQPIMASSFEAPAQTDDQSPTSEAFLACLQQEAGKIQAEFDSVTPMIAQARALLWLDTLARLHEAGLDEAIKSNDPKQASAWTRDLALFEVVISLVRNIEPMDLGDEAADGSASATPGLAAADEDVVVSIN
jgi:hypothetical protein